MLNASDANPTMNTFQIVNIILINTSFIFTISFIKRYVKSTKRKNKGKCPYYLNISIIDRSNNPPIPKNVIFTRNCVMINSTLSVCSSLRKSPSNLSLSSVISCFPSIQSSPFHNRRCKQYDWTKRKSKSVCSYFVNISSNSEYNPSVSIPNTFNNAIAK